MPTKRKNINKLNCFLLFAFLLIIPNLIALASLPSAIAADYSFTEDEIKAVYVFNIINFVTWPDTAVPSSRDPFKIGVIDTDQDITFLETFKKVISNETHKGQQIKVQWLTPDQDYDQYQVIYVRKSKRENLKNLFSSIAGIPILTIGEGKKFHKLGGMINLRRDGKRIKLSIDLDIVRAASLRVSSKLLRIAEVTGN